MGRQLRRVALDFDWPLSKVWIGFENPYYQFCRACGACDRSGLNRETKQLSDDWYDFARTGRRWSCAITQDEVDVLVKKGRLYDFTHTVVKGKGWVPKNPPYRPTAAEVNAWNGRGGLVGHDSLNQWICVETRARRLGIYGKCSTCKGSGELWYSVEAKRRAARWKEIQPPTGPGYQLWETVSEGSPITPVFRTADALARHLADGGGWNSDRGTTYEQWMRFISGPGWAPSGVVDNNGVHSGVDAVVPKES